MEGERSRPEDNTLTASLQRRAGTFEVQHVFMCIMSMMGATQFKLLNSRLAKRFLNHANHEMNAEGGWREEAKTLLFFCRFRFVIYFCVCDFRVFNNPAYKTFRT